MTTESLLSSRRRGHRSRRTITALAFFAIVFFLFGSTNAYAYWAVTSSLTTSASAGSLQVTSVWTKPVTKTFTNESYSATGAVKISNTTSTTTRAQTSMPYTLKFSLPEVSAGLNPLATVLKVKAWKITSGECTAAPTSPIYDGTWDDLIKLETPLGGSLKPTSSEIWCLDTSVDERSKLGSASGSVSLQPSVSAKLTLPGSNWTKDSAVSLGGVQQTNAIFLQRPPRGGDLTLRTADGLCADVTQGGGTGVKNVHVIQYTCNGGDNQRSLPMIVGTAAYDDRYIKISPYLPKDRFLSSVSTGATVQPATSGQEQHWQLQQRPNGALQLVNRSNGKCLTAPNNALGAQLVIQTCDAANVRQGFTGVPVPTPLTCTGSNTTANTYTWSPPTPSTEPYIVTVPQTGFTYTFPAGITSFKIWENGGTPSFNFSGVSSGTYPLYVTGQTTGEVKHIGQIRVSWLFGWLDCS